MSADALSITDITSQLQGTYYGLVHLQIATACYATPGDRSAIPKAVTDFIQNTIAAPPDPTKGGQPLPGYWQVDWGPAATTDNSNLSFICSFRAPKQGSTPGEPYFFAVGIRGTDISTGPLALVRQILQDFNSFTVANWSSVLGSLPNPAQRTVPSGNLGMVATGTAGGIRTIAGLTSSFNGSEVTIAAALGSLLRSYPNKPVVVTGHSLGGCQMQVMAAYLAWQLYGTQTSTVPGIIPHAFAPSTAGTTAFAATYDTLFGQGGGFWFNSLDLVPCGFVELNRVAAPSPYTTPELWTAYKWPPGSTYTDENGKVIDVSGTPGPAAPVDLVKAANTALKDPLFPHYARPGNNLHRLDGQMPTPDQIAQTINLGKLSPAGTLAMLEYHHFPQYYAQLVRGISGVQSYNFQMPPVVPAPQAALE